jgi:hypothetical protein
MLPDQYKMQRQKLKYMLSSCFDNNADISGKPVNDFLELLKPLLDNEQSKDISMLLISSEAILVCYRLRDINLLENNKPLFDFSIESLSYIQNIIYLIRDQLIDVRNLTFKTFSTPLYKVLEYTFLPLNDTNYSNKDVNEIDAYKLILQLSQCFGAYWRECLIKKTGEGIWKDPSHEQLSCLTLKANDGDLLINPAGIIYKAFINMFESDDLEEIKNNIFENSIIFKAQAFIQMSKQ